MYVRNQRKVTAHSAFLSLQKGLQNFTRSISANNYSIDYTKESRLQFRNNL